MRRSDSRRSIAAAFAGIGWLSEHIVAKNDFGIRAEHDRIVRVAEHRQSGARLFAGDAAHVAFGVSPAARTSGTSSR